MTIALRESKRPDELFFPIWEPLLAFNEQTGGSAKAQSYALEMFSEEDEKIAGGLWGQSVWGSFYVGLIFVPQERRGQGIGSRLMHRAEQEARDRGYRQMWLETYAFQGRTFYERLGYGVFGQIDCPPPVFPRYFMQKSLNRAEDRQAKS